MSSIENLRNLHSDPVQYAAELGPYVHEMGVRADIQQQTDLYLDQVKAVDPRFLDEQGHVRDHSLSRQELAALGGEQQLDAELERYGRLVGVIGADYKLDDVHEEADAVLVTGGVMTAIRDRALFALRSDGDAPIYVSGSPRRQNNTEAKMLAAMGLTPDKYPTEADLARLMVDELIFEGEDRDERLRLFTADAKHNAAMIRAFLAEHSDVGSLSTITTDHYVPFTAMDGGRARMELGKNTSIRTYADTPNPEKLKARTNEIYLTELLRSLRGAANWIAARQSF